MSLLIGDQYTVETVLNSYPSDHNMIATQDYKLRTQQCTLSANTIKHLKSVNICCD